MEVGADGSVRPPKARYWHVKDAAGVRQCLGAESAASLSSVLPRLRMVPEEDLKMLKGTPFYGFATGMRAWAVNSDGAAHRSLRDAMPKHFMSFAVVEAEHAAAADAYIDELLARVLAREDDGRAGGAAAALRRMEVMEDVTKPLSAFMLCRALGVAAPSEQTMRSFRRWAETIVQTDDVELEKVMAMAEAHAEGIAYFEAAIRSVRAAAAAAAAAASEDDDAKADAAFEAACGFTRNGIVALMVVGGRVPDDFVLANQFLMWVIGGFHNPANLGALALGVVLEHGEQLEELRRRAKAAPVGGGAGGGGAAAHVDRLLHCTVSEVMRTVSPADVVVRVVTAPLALPPATPGGPPRQAMPGDNVIMHLQAANHAMCPAASRPFNDFDAFRPLEFTGQHLGFGFGPHRCLGGMFGHMQAERLLKRLLLGEGGGGAFSRLALEEPFAFVVVGSFKEIPAMHVTF
jgi:cytochrome P450